VKLDVKKLDMNKIREMVKTNAVLIATIFVMLVLLLFLYIPKLSALSEVKKEFEDRAETMRSNHELIDKLVPIAAEHEAAGLELQLLHRKHAGQHQIPEMLHGLTAATGDLDLELRGINRSAQEKTAFFVRVPLELNIEGTYRSFAEYIDRITRIARLLDVRRIEISQAPEIYPRVRIKLLVDAYFLEDGGGAK
jgi:type IV pilus assembly protein PilO